jgi:phage I-like protein
MDRNDIARVIFTLAVANGAAPEWIQLTPTTTTFSSQDGRGPYAVKDSQAIIRASLLKGSIRLDYNHAVDLAAKAGFPSPAAGWITAIADHGPNNEPGLWGRVDWTPAGGKSVADKEYRYISPVLFTRKADGKDTGELVMIGGATLTNDPALVMQGLFHTTQETIDVNRKQLCAHLGLAESATDQQITDAIGKSGPDGKKKLASALGLPEGATDENLYAAVKKVGAQATNMARVLAAAGLDANAELDETTTVALCTKLKGSAAAPGAEAQTLQKQVDDLQKQLASLTQRHAAGDATAKVEAAIKAGKIVPAQKDWAIGYCTRDPQDFDKFVGNQPTILQDGRVVHGTPSGDGALTADEKHVCSLMGVKEEDFAKTRATLRRENA